jgi:hypothetical protein
MNLRKAVAQTVLSDHLFEKLRALRSRRLQVRLLEGNGLLDAAARYIERNGTTVKHGPFAGMIYPLEAALSRHSIPKLLGTYEQELHGVIRTLEKRKYDLVIDVGSAEGYYAVGLARLLRINVLAYDPEPIERSFCERAAQLNEVSKFVQLRDLFRPSDIHLLRERRVLCICDCEGFEVGLFCASTISSVSNWDLLIELHGDALEKLGALSWPHHLSTIVSEPRCQSFAELEGLGDPKKLLSEYRPVAQTWLWCDRPD